MARITVAPPRTISPPAKISCRLDCISSLTAIVFLRPSSKPSILFGTSGLGDTPTATITWSTSSVTVLPSTGTGLRRPDASGRRSPVPVEGKTVTLDVDQVIVAVGVSPNPLVPKSIEGLELGRKNTIAVSEEMQSSRKEIFAGGDIVRGGATVILAMGDGRRAALNMDKHLRGEA